MGPVTFLGLCAGWRMYSEVVFTPGEEPSAGSQQLWLCVGWKMYRKAGLGPEEEPDTSNVSVWVQKRVWALVSDVSGCV